MKIAKDKVVSIDYTLTNDNGQVLDTSDGREPLAYLHGHGNIIPGLEEELTGKEAGDKMDVTVPPEKAYGARNEQLMVQVDKSQFDPNVELKPGMEFQTQDQNGVHYFRLDKIMGDTVLLDGNHPLAGETLKFAVEIKDVREATKEELEHGHVHGPGGHQH